jgi:hypothetical protein
MIACGLDAVPYVSALVDALFLSAPTAHNMPHGYIYILTNNSMPGVVKVGKTTRHPSDRASQLSSATGVPEKFVLHHTFEVMDCDHAEKVAHRVLENAYGRPNSSREFFTGDPHGACTLLGDVLRSFAASTEPDNPSEFSLAIGKVTRKEFTMACQDFERLFQQHHVTEEMLVGSKSLQQAAGAYLAACIGAGIKPRFSSVLAPRVKAYVVECAIRHVSEFADDATSRVIAFVRTEI